MRPSRRRSSTDLPRSRWSSTCGRSGAGRARRSGPIIEKVVDETQGKVVLAKVDVDANPQIAQAFQVQSIPAVYALRDGKVVDGFVGAQPEQTVAAWVAELVPSAEESQVQQLLAAGDEASLRQAMDLEPDNAEVITALASLLAASDDGQDKVEALELLEKIPETNDTRVIAAQARASNPDVPDDVEARLDALLAEVKHDEDKHQEFLDMLELMGPTDPRTADYRKKLSAALF
ncbi:MAG: tetratricopeptide repeat protein [Acidimicrobiales bacterium]|nr:tetratricopeptide repeat protein [Acidimicrobiales bacterium]